MHVRAFFPSFRFVRSFLSFFPYFLPSFTFRMLLLSPLFAPIFDSSSFLPLISPPFSPFSSYHPHWDPPTLSCPRVLSISSTLGTDHASTSGPSGCSPTNSSSASRPSRATTCSKRAPACWSKRYMGFNLNIDRGTLTDTCCVPYALNATGGVRCTVYGARVLY